MALETPMVTEKMMMAAVSAYVKVDKKCRPAAMRAALEAALSTDAEPVAWYWEDATGCFHITLDRPDVKQMAAIVGCKPKPLYAVPPAAKQDVP